MTSQINDLIARIINRDDSALLALYDQFGGLVYSIAVRVLNDGALAEEVTQDVFMKVWEKVGQYDAEQASFSTWLGRIARNAAIDTLRKQERRRPAEALSIEDNPYTFERTLAAQYETPDRTQAITLHNSLQTLPPEQSELIYMAYFGGMSHTDIAKYTGLPLGTVKSRIRSGMQKLREAWVSNPMSEDAT